MMKDRAAALRYARALEGALGAEELARAADEMDAISQAMVGDPRIAEALRNPGFDSGSKMKALEAVARASGFSVKTTAFLKVMADHGRLGLVPQVAEMLGLARDRKLGIVRAEVTTAAPMSADLADLTRRALEKSTGRTVRMSLVTDPALIGGMIAKVGSTVYDGSVRTRLAALRSQLVHG